MTSFAIDLYLWAEEMQEWLFVPAAGSPLKWPAFPGISQRAILSGSGGLTFRADGALWLGGGERDSLPISMLAYGLGDSTRPVEALELRMKLPIGQHLVVKVEQGDDGQQVLVSRVSTRPANDYLEKTAIETGVYYGHYAISSALWESAVDRTLAGLALAVAAAPKSKLDPWANELAEWLSNRLLSRPR